MYKGLVTSILFVLCLSPVAFSNVGQADNFQINAENMIYLNGGPSLAIGGNSITVGQIQVAATPGLDFKIAIQADMGILNQGASAVSFSAIMGAAQKAGIIGQQTQTDNAGTIEQEQNAGWNLEQDVNKNDGIGGIIAGQGVILGQIQIIANRNGISGNVNISGATQLEGKVSGVGDNPVSKQIIAIATPQ